MAGGKWEMTSALMALTANCNRSKDSEAFPHDYFNPFVPRKSTADVRGKLDAKASVDAIGSLFGL